MGVLVVSRLRAFVRKARHKALRSDLAGSVHVLETMVVGLMVVGAVVAVSTFNAPVSETESFKTSQERLVQDALDTLAGRPSQDMDSVVFDSVLEEYVMKAVAGERGPLMEYLNRTLPAGSQYDVFLDTGFGRPLSLVDGGTPTGESLTGARSFVPKMSYVFMVPEFQKYQHDFHMNVLAIPMHNSILQKDEGVPVEVAVTFTTEEGSTVTQRAYAETALRHNEPDARSWASTSIYIKDDPNDPNEAPRHYLDASNTKLYGQASVDTILGGEKFGDAYNITIPLVVEESAGHPIPRGAQIFVEFPRGWLFAEKHQAWTEKNLKHWTDFDWDGSDGEGWTISARLKDPLKNGTVPFPITGNFVMLLDSSYPHFQPIVTWMGGGAQGKSTILLNTPQELDVGGFRRETFLSLPKPMISGKPSTWGFSLANLGSKAEGKISVEKVEFRQPQGVPLLSNFDEAKSASWLDSDKPGGSWEWDPSEPSKIAWTPTGSADLAEGEAAWLSLHAIGGPTRDNHYRNHDYQDVLFHFDPNNTTKDDSSGNWSYVQRAHQMNEEYVYREMVPPLEDEGWPGWPDLTSSYWFGGESRQQSRYAVGNTSYEVDTKAATAQIFGDYQGDHVLSRIDLADPYGEEKRTFSLEDRVHIKNDFSALFTRLSTMDLNKKDLSVENITIESKVYTPEKAWTGEPTKTYTEDASFDHLSGSFGWLLPVDLTDNGILDLIAVDTSGTIYALDGRDGSKLWQFRQDTAVIEAVLSDVTADGRKDLVLADEEDELAAYRLDLGVPDEDREIWRFDLDPDILDWSVLELDSDTDTAKVTAMVDVSREGMDLGDPAFAVAYSSTKAGASVLLVSTQENKLGHYEAAISGVETRDANDEFTWIPDMIRMERDLGDGTVEEYLAVASMDRTVQVFSLPGFKVHWTTKLPQRAHGLAAADLTGDGWDDLVVNTAHANQMEALGDHRMGDSVYVLPGSTGHFGPAVRNLDALSSDDFSAADAIFNAKGWMVGVGGTPEVVQDHSGFYAPQLAVPSVGVCELESTEGEVDTGLMTKPADDLSLWLESKKWRGAHLDRADDSLYIVSASGVVLKAVEDCPDGRLRWEQVTEGSENAGPFVGLHAYDAGSSGGSLYRLNESGRIELHDGDSGWDVVADVCTLKGMGDCKGVTVNRWSVEEDADGRPVRFWATLEWVDPSDGSNDRMGHLVSVLADGLAPESALEDASWTLEYSSSTETLHALEASVGGKVSFGGGTVEGGVFLLHRESEGKPFETQRVFYSTATKEHGVLMLDILETQDGEGWAMSLDGQIWKRAASDVWVPWPSWAEETQSAVLAEDPTGTVWSLLDGADHLPIRTHQAQSEIRFELDAGGSETYEVHVDSEEAHLTSQGQPVTDINWYARPTGLIEGTAQPHPWTSLSTSDGIGSLEDGWSPKSHFNYVHDMGGSTSIEVKAVLETRTLTGADGEIVQDPGSSPALRNTEIEIQADDKVVAGATFSPGEAQEKDDHSSIDPGVGGYVLTQEPHRWMYRGGVNKEWVEEAFASGDNRRIDTGDSLPTSNGEPGVVIIDQSGVRFDWWVLNSDTGVPERPLTGPEGKEAGEDWVDRMIVGDITGDGVDDVVIVGDMEEKKVARVWDTQKDEWSLIGDYLENPIIQAVAFMGNHQGKGTFVFALPAKSVNLVPEGLGAEAEQAHSLISFYGPEYDEDLPGYKTPEVRWATAPHIMQGFTTFSYEIPKNSLYGTSIVVSELKFDLTNEGETLTQTARILTWFDILPPGRTQSVPPVYTVEVVAWFSEGSAQVESLPVATRDGDGENNDGGGGMDVLPEPRERDVNTY